MPGFEEGGRPVSGDANEEGDQANYDGLNPDARNGGDCGDQQHVGPRGDAEKQGTARSMATPMRKTTTDADKIA